MHYLFVTERMLKNEIELKKIPAKEQPDGVFTEALEKTLFEKVKRRTWNHRKGECTKGAVRNTA